MSETAVLEAPEALATTAASGSGAETLAAPTPHASLRAATRAERRALLAAIAAQDSHVPYGTHPRVLSRMRDTGWIVGFVITTTGRRAAFTRPQWNALTTAAHNDGNLTGAPFATIEALIRTGCAERRDTQGRTTVERTGTPYTTTIGRRAVDPNAPDTTWNTPPAAAASNEPLSSLCCAVLELAGRNFLTPAHRDRAVREERKYAQHDLTPTRYYQLLNALLDDPRALAHAPVTVNRLRGIRDTERARR